MEGLLKLEDSLTLMVLNTSFANHVPEQPTENSCYRTQCHSFFELAGYFLKRACGQGKHFRLLFCAGDVRSDVAAAPADVSVASTTHRKESSFPATAEERTWEDSIAQERQDDRDDKRHEVDTRNWLQMLLRFDAEENS